MNYTHLHHLLGNRLRQASYLLALVAIYLFIDFVSYSNIAIVVYGLVGVGVVLTIFNFRWGVYYLLGIYLFSDDTPRIMELVESRSFASIHFTDLGGYTLSLICTIFIAYMLHLRYLVPRTNYWPQVGSVDRIMMALIAVYAVGGIIGLPNLLQFHREYMTDLGYIINTITYYIVVRMILNRPEDIKYLIYLLTAGYGVKCLAGIVYYALGIGYEAGLNYRVLFESGRTLLVLTFFLCLSLFHFGRGILNREHRIFLLISGFAMVFNIITFASRLNMIFLVLGLVLFVYYIRKQEGRGMGAAFGILMLVGLSVGAVAVIRPGALDYVWWKLISLQDWSLNSEMDLGSLSIAIRVIQLLNIVYMHIYEGTYIWGTGLGGWFTDEYFSYPVDFIAMSVANAREISLGRFFKPATMTLVVLLKFGFAGFIIYYWILIRLFITTGRIYASVQDYFTKAVLLGILVSLPVYFDKNHTSKINAFYGIAIGIVANVEQNNRKRRD